MEAQLDRLILQASPDAIIAIDAEEKVLAWNPRAEKLFGWSQEEMAGKPLAERILPSRFRDEFERAMYRNLGGTHRGAHSRSDTGENRVEMRARGRSGKEFPIDLAVSPFQEGAEWRFAVVIRDLTGQHGRIARAAIDSRISRLLAAAADRDTVERRILEIICEADGWDFGCYWRAKEQQGRLACVAIQQGPLEAFAEIRDACLGFRPARGQGLPGRILEEGHPRWFKDLGEEGTSGRGEALRAAGFKSAFGFPIRLGPRAFGVCEFISRSERPLDPEMLETVGALSGPIALFFRQKESEAALRESEERFRLLIENSNDGISVRDRGGYIIYNSPATQRLSGYAHDEVIGMRALDLIHPDDLEQFHESMRPIYDVPGARIAVTFRIKHKDGSWRWLESRATNLLDDPRIGGILSNFRDITVEHEAKLERERLLGRLEGEARRLGRVLDSLPNPVLLEEPGTGTVRLANQAALRLAQDASDAADAPEVDAAGIEHLLFAFTDPDGKPLTGQDAPGARAARGEALVNLEIGLASPSGRRTLLVNSAVLASEEGAAEWVVLAFLDVTALKVVEAQLRQSQKVEAVGQLAGGIAHDFNNLLTAISGYAGMALAKAQADSPLAGYIGEVIKAGERASALTRQLLSFSRRQPVETRRWDINAILEDMAPMLRRLIMPGSEGAEGVKPTDGKAEISIDIRPADRAAPIRADRSQIEQVILNLALNARDAMPKGGELALAISISEDPLEGALLKEEAPGPYAVVESKDTGTGITPEVKSRIFEPFFTTKDAGKGTGLGLAVVIGVVKACKGGLSVVSAPGHGTTFRISLPMIPEPAPKLQAEDQVPPRPEEEVAAALA